MRIALITFFLMSAATVSASAAHLVTCYRDGTLHQLEAGATRGVIHLPLPADLLEQTLTVIPASGTTIVNVETVNRQTGPAGKEFEALTEQRSRLEDRLQALETREAIFTSAAKAQSGKAPRKTKANPDPMQAIRQGTDYAIAQLEAVYTARRKTIQEIGRIDSRIAAARKNGKQAERIVRIEVTPPRGKVTVRYGTSERAWLPRYNLQVTADGSVLLQFSGHIAEGKKGQNQLISSGSLADSPSAATVPAANGSALLATVRLPLTEEHYSQGFFSSFSGRITNTGSGYLPPGTAGLFRNGTYMGTFVFEGLSSGRSRVISLGR